MVGGVKRLKKGETSRKNFPRKAQGNHRLGDIGVSGMLIMQWMLDWIECALDEIHFYVLRRNFNGHNNTDVSYVKITDRLSNCQLSEQFDVLPIYTI